MSETPSASPPAGGRVELPGHGSCFICGRDNPSNLGIVFYLEGGRGGRVKTSFTPDERHQGPPRHVHGGCLSSVLDEAMGAAVWCAGHPVVAARLEIDFRRAVPLGHRVEVEAWVTRVDGRKVWAESELRLGDDGAVATRGKGLFIEKPELFDGDYFVPRL